jgi:excisionase family DNA binding protein
MKALKKISHQGQAYYSVGDAAKYLGTTATKIRQMMGDGSLKWAQLRVNGRLLITAESLAQKRTELQSKDSKPSK